MAGNIETPRFFSAEAVEADRRANSFVAAGDPFGAFADRVKHLPMWLFHAVADDRAPIDQSRKLGAALKVAGSNVVRSTEYVDTNHNGSADKTYADPEMMTWLLAQRRTK